MLLLPLSLLRQRMTRTRTRRMKRTGRKLQHVAALRVVLLRCARAKRKSDTM
jgi:hypothetical protein